MPRNCLPVNAFRTRADVQRAVTDLCTPVEACRSAGGARVRISGPRAVYDDTAQEMEGFARQLWGLAPLLAGGGRYTRLSDISRGLAAGCNPVDDEYWAAAVDFDQRLVEYAAIAYGLLLSPEHFWRPLASMERTNLARFLRLINERQVRDNNWRFFRVLVNLALARVGEEFSSQQIDADLDRIDTFYLGNGWYADGPGGAADYYTAFAMHFYGLVCARPMREVLPHRSSVLEDRAVAFAGQFLPWFSSDGPSVPYGRSLTYRFAQAAFWSALAFSGLDAAISPGALKSVILRHLRWWWHQPIVCDRGLLTSGYAYQTQLAAERYSSPCSPYWGLKTFLPLALPADAPFWTEAECEPPAVDAVIAQAEPGMIVCRDGAHVFALAAAARVPLQHARAPAKYGKFCYSTHFAFSLPNCSLSLPSGAHDSALALAEDRDGYYRTREASHSAEVSRGHIVSRWRPWSDVEVTTWLIAAMPWHVRVHQVLTARRLHAAEGGFAVGIADTQTAGPQPALQLDATAIAAGPDGFSAIVELSGGRCAETISVDPNTHLLWPRTVIPTLHGFIDPGVTWLACAVLGLAECTESAETAVSTAPTLNWTAAGFLLVDYRGRTIHTETLHHGV